MAMIAHTRASGSAAASVSGASTSACRVPRVARRAVAVRAAASAGPDAPSTSSRRELLLSTAGLALFAGAWAPSGARATESAAEKAVEEYAQAEAAGKFKTLKALEDFRNKQKFKRGIDGRVWLKSSKGEWFQVRLDMEVPGAMLFRDPTGYVYALQTEALQQIDLSNDQVCILMFSDGDWESTISPIEYQDEQGTTKTLKMNESDFRNVVGLISLMDKEEEKPKQ